MDFCVSPMMINGKKEIRIKMFDIFFQGLHFSRKTGGTDNLSFFWIKDKKFSCGAFFTRTCHYSTAQR